MRHGHNPSIPGSGWQLGCSPTRRQHGPADGRLRPSRPSPHSRIGGPPSHRRPGGSKGGATLAGKTSPRRPERDRRRLRHGPVRHWDARTSQTGAGPGHRTRPGSSSHRRSIGQPIGHSSQAGGHATWTGLSTGASWAATGPAASTIEVHVRSHVNDSARARARVPSVARSSGSSSSSASLCARLTTSSRGKRRPPSPTSSGLPPVAEATIGNPVARPSRMVNAHGSSQREGTTWTSLVRRALGTCSRGTWPSWRTSTPLSRSSAESFSTKRRVGVGSVRPQLVSPTNWTAKSVRSWAKTRHARRKVSGAFSTQIRPTNPKTGAPPSPGSPFAAPGRNAEASTPLMATADAKRLQLIGDLECPGQVGAHGDRMEGSVTNEPPAWPIRDQLQVVEPVHDLSVRETSVAGGQPVRGRCCKR